MKKNTYKKRVIMKISNIVMIVLGAVVVGFATLYPKTSQKDKEATIVEAVMYIMNHYHYSPQDINDEFSKKAFKNYLKYLDSGKRFLIQSEVDELKKHELLIDDYIRTGDISFFENSINTLNNAIDRAEIVYNDVINQKYELESNDSIFIKPEDKEFANNKKELKDIWRKSIQYDIVSRLEDKAEENDEETDIEKKKDFATLKEESQEKVKDNFNKWFKRMHKVKRSDRFETYLNAITSVFDPHTSYFSPREKENFDIRMGGKLEGIGAQLRTDGDFTKVIKIIPGGPASRGDELEAEDIIQEVRQEEEIEAISIEGMVIDDVVQLIRGKKGTVVFLTVKKADGTKEIIRIERDEVILDESFARSMIIGQDDVIGKIGYIKLPKFYADFKGGDRSCSDDIAKELEKLKANNVKGIILDLRNNSGGSLKDVVSMSGLFIEKGPITRVQGKKGKAKDYSDNDSSVQYDGPLIVMTNKHSASASEILAAAMQDYGRAIIVGSSSTFGKGTVQRFFDLDRVIQGHDDAKPLGELKMTMQKFYRVNGGTTQLTGVIPDIILPDNYHFTDYGEKEYDYPLGSNKIEPSEYHQDVVHMNHLKEIVINSNNRITQDTNFMRVLENAKRLERNGNITTYPLDFESYNTMIDNQVAEGEKFKDLFDNEIEGFSTTNLPEDIEYINSDESRIDRNKKWMENMRKDFYVSETLKIMKDMIDLEEDFADVRK